MIKLSGESEEKAVRNDKKQGGADGSRISCEESQSTRSGHWLRLTSIFMHTSKANDGICQHQLKTDTVFEQSPT